MNENRLSAILKKMLIDKEISLDLSEKYYEAKERLGVIFEEEMAKVSVEILNAQACSPRPQGISIVTAGLLLCVRERDDMNIPEDEWDEYVMCMKAAIVWLMLQRPSMDIALNELK